MGSQVLSFKSYEVNPFHLTVERMEVGTYHFIWVPSHDYDMDAYTATLFGGKAWDLCCKWGRAKS